MELTWPMRLRIAAAAAVGVVLIGILAWPLAAPTEPSEVVRAGNINFRGAAILVVAAFLAGYIGYFVSWPYGREIGILAVPSGLAIWAVRTGSMASLLQLNPAVAQRQALFATLKWEAIFWLLIVAAGFAGVLAGQKTRLKPGSAGAMERPDSKPGRYLNSVIALACSILIAQFCIGILAQDVRVSNDGLGSVVGQPAVGQIVFAVLVSFGLAAFVVKGFLDVSYIWPAIASGLVTAFSIAIYARGNMLAQLADNRPAVFFSNAVISVLPLQMVAFGTLGSVWGYWLAVRYNFWRKGPPEEE